MIVVTAPSWTGLQPLVRLSRIVGNNMDAELMLAFHPGVHHETQLDRSLFPRA